MPPAFPTLLEEFERLSLDDRLFFSLLNEEGLEVHISFRRGEGRPWSAWFALSEEGSRQTCSRQHFPDVLRSFRIAESLIAGELGNCLLMQAAFADQFVREVSEIFGFDAVRQSIRSTQDFMDLLRNQISTVLVEPAPGELKARKVPRTTEAVEGDPKSAPQAEESDRQPGKGRLRVVKS